MTLVHDEFNGLYTSICMGRYAFDLARIETICGLSSLLRIAGILRRGSSSGYRTILAVASRITTFS